jgi:hypothetical protein
MFFSFLGKKLFPHQQKWGQERNARIITTAVVFGLALGLFIVMLIRMVNSPRH